MKYSTVLQWITTICCLSVIGTASAQVSKETLESIRFVALFQWVSLILATPVALWSATPFFAADLDADGLICQVPFLGPIPFSLVTPLM